LISDCARIVKALLLIALVGFAGCSRAASTLEIYFARGEEVLTPRLKAEIAVTPGARQLGLMYRKEMEPHSAMLFVFPDERHQSFWMKNTYLSLDIIFINKEKQVVSISHEAVPLSLTPRESAEDAMYVVEVLGGLAKQWGLTKGDIMVHEETIPTSLK
jgi:hypothetical protein